jgi:hypothetical protein
VSPVKFDLDEVTFGTLADKKVSTIENISTILIVNSFMLMPDFLGVISTQSHIAIAWETLH